MLDKQQHISFFGPSLLRLSVNTCDAELYRHSLATDDLDDLSSTATFRMLEKLIA